MKIKINKKTKYRVKNWPEYSRALKQRGSMELWITDDIVDRWQAEPSGRPGNQPVYSDFAIEIVIRFGKVFRQKLRQTEGLLEYIFKLTHLDLPVPDYSTVSRRAGRLNVVLFKKKVNQREKKIIVIDSTGLKVYGEGEWKTKVHGKSKNRTWRKAHIGISPDGEIQAAELTENCVADGKVASNLLRQIDAEIISLAGDGGYDRTEVYNACQKRKIKNILIPPQKNAKIWRHGNFKSGIHPRDENLRQIRRLGREKWKEISGYHVRSLVETTMFRLKTIAGGKLNFRKYENQVSEFLISCNILNRMTELGMPDSYAVA